jgi:shikimate 5-dehydrogenase
VGTGGAGCALAVALCDAGISTLYLNDIFPEKAEHLPKDYVLIILKSKYWHSIPPSDIDLAINASNSGLQPNDPCHSNQNRLGNIPSLQTLS